MPRTNEKLVKWLDDAIAQVRDETCSTSSIINAINSEAEKGTDIFNKKDALISNNILTRVAHNKTAFLTALYNMRLRADGLYNL